MRGTPVPTALTLAVIVALWPAGTLGVVAAAAAVGVVLAVGAAVLATSPAPGGGGTGPAGSCAAGPGMRPASPPPSTHWNQLGG